MKKVVIITGVSSGIGKTLAYEMAKEGYKVIGTFNRTPEGGEELKKQNNEIDILKADVTKREEIKNVVEYAVNKYGRIDILVNNAGISEYKMFNDETDEDWNRVITTNLYSAFAMSQEVSKYMIRQKDGLIINITSMWGITGASMEVIYSVSKAGMTGLTKSLAKELGLSNIRVNSIAPGMIETRMNAGFTDEEKKEICSQIPLGKIGSTYDISKCVMWLANDNYTTGQEISVNGGYII